MVPRPTLLLLALAASAIGAPATQNDNAVDMKVPEQTPEQMANSDQGHVVVNVFGNFEVEPMCRANGRKCRLNASCCSGYCSWHQGYKCADRSAALEEEEGPLPEKGPDIEPMCRPNNTRCRLNSSCCSGYCSWHKGYKCADRSAALEEEGPLPEKGPDIEPMCRPNNTRCRLNSSCCSGYCSWHQGYKCADRSAALEEGVSLREEI